ncbi:MAG: phospholipase D-like domain-containing protein [Nanoarchaeota archaeon]|nr:phospholipase D-like domain-containing protein [Nanoarchaeota archaeon]
MKTISNNDKIYIGKKAGTGLLRDIKEAKSSVKIVSPYLSASYLSELVELNKKGVKITLITADELKEDKYGYSNFKHTDIIKQKRTENPEARTKKRKLKVILITLFLIAFVIALSSIFFFTLIYLSVLLVLIGLIILIFYYFIKEHKFEYYCIFRLKIFDSSSGKKPQSKELIHSKIFVIDEKTAFLGSANFTYSGFNTHYETLIKIEDQRAVNDISQEVENLYNSTELSSKSIDEWGKEIYE